MSEKRFLAKIAGVIPEAPGYRQPGGRAETDERLRGHVAGSLESLRGKLSELKTAADEEGEEDMVDDLDRIDARMERTIGSLRGADYAALDFFSDAPISDAALDRICAYDQELLEDVDLLAKDVMGMRYETIGNLTLREIEGTLAAIELKVANRQEILAGGGDDAGP